MKLIVVSFFTLALSATFAFANTYNCVGRQLPIGGEQSHTGHVSFNMGELNASWTVEGGSENTWLSKTSLCGIESQGSNCFTQDTSMSRTPGIRVFCRKPNSEQAYAVLTIVMSEVTHNGRMSCEAVKDKKQVHHVLEFHSCEAE